MNRNGIVLLAVLTAAITAGASAQTERPRGPVIRQVDRILIESGDLKALFNFFADTLQLPVAWPMTENRGFTSAGVGAGNVSLEFHRNADSGKAPGRKIAEAYYSGLAFEPSPLSRALYELQAREIPYGPPEPYISTLPNGSTGLLWTSVPLNSVSRPGMSIYLFECSPLFLKVAIHREQLANRLAFSKGGPLGLRSIREILIVTPNPVKDKAAWKQLLEKQTPSGNWLAGEGPSIRLVPGTSSRIQEIVAEVVSLSRAKDFLKKKRLLGSTTSKAIFLKPATIQGLRIRLTEAEKKRE